MFVCESLGVVFLRHTSGNSGHVVLGLFCDGTSLDLPIFLGLPLSGRVVNIVLPSEQRFEYELSLHTYHTPFTDQHSHKKPGWVNEGVRVSLFVVAVAVAIFLRPPALQTS